MYYIFRHNYKKHISHRHLDSVNYYHIYTFFLFYYFHFITYKVATCIKFILFLLYNHSIFTFVFLFLDGAAVNFSSLPLKYFMPPPVSSVFITVLFQCKLLALLTGKWSQICHNEVATAPKKLCLPPSIFMMLLWQRHFLPLSLALSWLESPSGSGVSGFRLRPSLVGDFSSSLADWS